MVSRLYNDDIVSDKEIVEGLIARDEKITRLFFFVKCRPLFYSVIAHFFSYPVDYDELVNELYVNIMANDAQGLRSFSFQSSLCQWLKRVAYNYFSHKFKRERFIEDKSREEEKNEEQGLEYGLLHREVAVEVDTHITVMDLKALLSNMTNERNRYVLEKLYIEAYDYDELAKMMGTSKANLYNIRKRAVDELSQVALRDKTI